jgi:hypothetical protein
MHSDVENDSVKITYLKGYPSLAAFIASDKDKSTVIYRRFDRLSARNLLYLQSELAELEAKQDTFDAEDLRASTEEKGVASNWLAFKARAAEDGNEREKERMQLVREIREKIKEYREAILLESTLVGLKSPSRRTWTAMRNTFYNTDSGEEYPTLGGNSAGLYDDRNDLMALRVGTEEDRLTAFMRYSCPWLFVVSQHLAEKQQSPRANRTRTEKEYGSSADIYFRTTTSDLSSSHQHPSRIRSPLWSYLSSL